MCQVLLEGALSPFLMGCSATGSFTPTSSCLLAVTLSHLSPQEDFANARQGICWDKGLTEC